MEHVCRSQTGDSRSANLAKVSAEILGKSDAFDAFLEFKNNAFFSSLCWDFGTLKTIEFHHVSLRIQLIHQLLQVSHRYQARFGVYAFDVCP